MNPPEPTKTEQEPTRTEQEPTRTDQILTRTEQEPSRQRTRNKFFYSFKVHWTVFFQTTITWQHYKIGIHNGRYYVHAPSQVSNAYNLFDFELKLNL